MESEPTIYANNSSSMAASSAATSFSTMAPTMSSINLMNQSLLLLSNMANMMIVKLDNTNYIVWKHQITIVLKTYSMFELLDEPQSILDKFLKDMSGNITVIMNPDYLVWRSKEKVVLTFMSSMLSPLILALIVGFTFAIDVCKVLEDSFSSISRSYVMNLKGELHNMKKGSNSVDVYL